MTSIFPYQKRSDENGIAWPPCEACGKVAGFEDYPFAKGFLQCKNCHSLESVPSLAERYNNMMDEHRQDIHDIEGIDEPGELTIPWGEDEQNYYRNAKVAAETSDKEIKWFITPDEDVLMEDPDNPVPNHLALLMQQKGTDYVNQVMSTPDVKSLGLQGVIRNGRLQVGGVLMSDMSTPSKYLDPNKTMGAHLKTQRLMNVVAQKAAERGIEIDPSGYSQPYVHAPDPETGESRGMGVKDRGFVTTDDPAVLNAREVLQQKSNVKESEYHYIRKEGDEYCIWQKSTGKTLSCHASKEKAEEAFRAMMANKHGTAKISSLACPNCGSDQILPSQHWDHSIWECHHCGKMGYSEEFEHTGDMDTLEHDHHTVNPMLNGPIAKVASTSFEYPLPPLGLHMRTHNVMGNSGLSARVTYPPGITSRYPEGFVSDVPGRTGMQDMMLPVDYEMENDGKSVEGVPVTIETEHDPTHVQAVFDELGGKPSPYYETLPDHIRSAIDAMTGRGRTSMTLKTAEEIGDLYNQDEKKAIVCPNCGSHSFRAFGVDGDSNAQLKCLTCGKEWLRPVFKNPQASVKTAEDGKHPTGTRVQVEHHKHKGQRGTLIGFKGRDEDLDEEKYEIQLDNGTKLEGLNEGHFKKIKSARVDNTTLPPTSTDNHFIESMVFVSENTIPDGPELPDSSMNKLKDDYDPEANDEHFLEPEEQDVECPMCHGNASHLGDLGARAYHKCRDCGMEFSHPRTEESERWAPDDPNDMFGLDKPSYASVKEGFDDFGGGSSYGGPNGVSMMPQTPGMGMGQQQNQNVNPGMVGVCPQCGQRSLVNGVCTNCGYQDPTAGVQTPVDGTMAAGRMSSSLKDTTGNDLQEGSWYILHGRNYKVPDVVKIVKLKDNGLTAHFETDKEGQFPLQIESSDDNYRFDPYQRSEDPLEIDEKAIKAASGWQVEARRNFSVREQQDLIDENLEGRARNYDKLNLDGTHYQVRESLFDADFLWGM